MDKSLIAKFEKNQQTIAKLNREIEKAVGAQITKRAELEAQNADMKQAILEAMEANGAAEDETKRKYDGDLITITYVAESKRTTFDSTKFKTAMPKTYAKFLKTGTTKAYVKLAVKA